jgi:DNA-binding NtrC family response regulator
MNGDELALAIKKIDPELPVIMLTGFGDFMRASGEQPEGIRDIVSKPIKVNELRQALGKISEGLRN